MENLRTEDEAGQILGSEARKFYIDDLRNVQEGLQELNQTFPGEPIDFAGLSHEEQFQTSVNLIKRFGELIPLGEGSSYFEYVATEDSQKNLPPIAARLFTATHKGGQDKISYSMLGTQINGTSYEKSLGTMSSQSMLDHEEGHLLHAAMMINSNSIIQREVVLEKRALARKQDELINKIG